MPEEMMIEMETRPIGAEDIGWDIEGNGEKGYFEDSYGETKSYSKLNAYHLPVPKAVREAVGGAKDVGNALLDLASKFSESESSGGMEEDKTVILYTSFSLTEKQARIDECGKNLGGKTLTIQFQEAGDEVFPDPLNFYGFYNGTMIIDLNAITISDSTDIGSLFAFSGCFCKILIKNGSLQHTNSLYGVKADHCPAVYFEDLHFTGIGTTGSYAFYGISSDGFAEDCDYTRDNPVLISGQIVDYIDNVKEDFYFISMASAKSETGSPTNNLIFNTVS